MTKMTKITEIPSSNKEILHYALTLEEITIANPCILDEQYTGAATKTPAPEITGTGAPAKPALSPSTLLALAMLFIAIFVIRR